MTERLTIKASSGLIHLIDNSENGVNHAIKKLSEYEVAEEEGKLVVLPCKVGDTVWTFYDDMSDVVDFTVEKIQIVFDKDGDPYFLIDGMDFEIDCLGKTLFFDCEDAKRELNKIKECYEL